MGAAIEREQIEPREDLVLRGDPTRKSLWHALRYVLAVPTNRALILASGLGYFFFSGLRTFTLQFVRDHFGLGQGAALAVLAVAGVGGLAGAIGSGRLADRLVARGHVAGRLVVAGGAFLLAALAFAPGILLTVLVPAVAFIALGVAGLAGVNPPLDSARLDVVPAGLWGRAESARTMLRSLFEALAPLTFGAVAALVAGPATTRSTGLALTLLLMLAPVLAASAVLLIQGRRTYPRDAATATASASASPGRG